MEDIEATWATVLERVRRSNEKAYDKFASKLVLLKIAEDGWHLSVPNMFTWDFYTGNYVPVLAEAAEQVCGTRPRFIPEEAAGKDPDGEKAVPESVAAPVPVAALHPGLRPNYTFEKFVTVDSNKFARNAAEEVARSIPSRYNPLFIHGGTGLGKTHLIHAIGHRVALERGVRSVLYVTSEEFLNDYTTAIRTQKMEEFRTRYRKLPSLLLMDDIQFLAAGDKTRTQEEFFHTFNDLLAAGRQIVITSDRFPKELHGVEDRLRSRFEWGLEVRINPPDFDERLRILKKKAVYSGVVLPDDVAVFIAENARTSIRELEGALIKLEALAKLTGSDIDTDLVHEALEGFFEKRTAALTADDVIQMVCNYYKVKPQDIKSQRRHREIVEPRQMAMFLCRKHLKLSFPDIGGHFGGKDHATVIASVKKVEKMLVENPKFRTTLESVETRLLNK
ncbi:MAG: chromosomal replication initiator protein DnaA [Myxococcota bacterium]